MGSNDKMQRCTGCGRVIKGQYLLHSPHAVSIMLGTDKPGSWHTACHERHYRNSACEYVVMLTHVEWW